MSNMTLAIPKGLHEKMRTHPEIRWSEVARVAIQKKIEDLELMDRLSSDSKLTEEDAVILGRIINKSAAERMIQRGKNFKKLN